MSNTNFKYLRNTSFCKYDENLDSSFLFENEIDLNKPSSISKKRRYVINKESIKSPTLYNSIEIINNNDCIQISYKNDSLLLVNAGVNILFLAFVSSIKKEIVNNILYTYLQKEDTYIDVTKYKHLFINPQEIALYNTQK